GRDPDRAGNRWRGRRVRHDLPAEIAEATEDHPEPVDRLPDADPDRRRQVAGERPEEPALVLADPERALLRDSFGVLRRADRGLGAERDGELLGGSVGVLDRECHAFADVIPEVEEEVRFAEELILPA